MIEISEKIVDGTELIILHDLFIDTHLSELLLFVPMDCCTSLEINLISTLCI